MSVMRDCYGYLPATYHLHGISLYYTATIFHVKLPEPLVFRKEKTSYTSAC